MLSSLEWVKQQQLIFHAAMRLHNQEHSPGRTTFTSLHSYCFLSLYLKEPFKEEVMIPTLALTPLISPESQSLERYTVH